MAKRSFKTIQGLEEDNSETESEDEVTEERKVMIRVVPRERFERTGLINYSPCERRLCCQADECGSDLRNAKQYHRRHKVCESHAKAGFVLVKGIRHRFCQQCSRFHQVSEFDGAKRSCRNRLAGHNERRRKTQDQQAENVKTTPTSNMNSSSSLVNMKDGELTLQGCANTKHLRIT